MNGETNNTKVYGAAVIFTLIVGFSFLGVKACTEVADPLEILVHRFNFAFLAALVPVIVKKAKVAVGSKKKQDILLTAGFYVGFMALQTIGLLFATSIEAGIIFAVIPILAKIIAGIFLKETTTWKQNIFTCVSVAAVIAMFVCGTADINVSLMGLIILFMSSLMMAISNVMIRGVRNAYTPYEIAFCIALFGFVLFNAAAVVRGIQTGTLSHYFAPLASPMFLAAIAYLGVLSTLVSSLLMSYMLAHLEAMKATIFGNLSTAISIVAGAVVLREPLLAYHLICTALIILGVVGVSLPSMGVVRGKLKSEHED